MRPGSVSARFLRAAVTVWWLFLLFGCVLVFSSCTPAGYRDHETEHVLSDHANFPRTLTLQGLAVDYPEGFDASEETVTTFAIEDTIYSGKRRTIANSDFSIFFNVEAYEGMRFEDIERAVVGRYEQRKEGSVEPSEAIPEFNIPEGFNLLFTMREPEYLTVNGNRVLLMVVGRTDAEEAHVYQYFLPIGNSAVGRVWFGCTDEEYKADPAVYDGIIASMRVDGR